MTPVVHSDVDKAYLVQALERAGLPSSVSGLKVESLFSGRTSSTLKRLSWLNDEKRSTAILKILPPHSWRDDVMDGGQGGEAALWLAGFTRDLPNGLNSAVLDVARHGESDAWWMLMRDVSSGIRPRGAFTDGDERALLKAVARLHARYWDAPEIEQPSLATMVGTTRIWAEPLVTLVRGARAVSKAPEWVRRFLADFELMGLLVPRFLELMSPEDADFIVDLARFRHWEVRLDEGPQTLVHGDLQRANIALLDGQVTLIDWEFAARGPAATDLIWHWFHHFWAYPSGDDQPEAREALKAYYLGHLEQALGEPIDREQFDVGWDIGWLRILVQLGYLLVDGVYGDLSADDLARVRMKCRAAVAYAKDVCDRQLP